MIWFFIYLIGLVLNLSTFINLWFKDKLGESITRGEFVWYAILTLGSWITSWAILIVYILEKLKEINWDKPLIKKK